MRNSYIRFISFIVCFVLIICAFSACKNSDTDTSTSSVGTSSDVQDVIDDSDNVSSENEEVFSDEAILEDDYYEDDYYEDEETETLDNYTDEILIKNGSEPIMTNYLGLNAIYHGYMYIPDETGRMYNEKQTTLEYSRIKQMGMHTVRTYYDSKYAYDAASDSWNWESEEMKGFYRWAKDMAEMDIDISLNTHWSIGGLTQWDSFYAKWHGLFVEGDKEATVKNHTNWMVESLKQFRAHGVNNIEYLFLLTEPGKGGTGRTIPDKNIEDIPEVNFDDWLMVVKSLDEGLKSAEMRSDYKFVGPNSVRYLITANSTLSPMFYQAITQANDYIDIYSNHTYLLLPSAISDVVPELIDMQWKQFADYTKEKTGKDFWIDEYNVAFGEQSQIGETRKSPWQALQHAVALSCGMNIGVKNQMMWTLADQQWPNIFTNSDDGFINGVQAHGVLPSLFETSVPQISYYGVSLLTKYFGNYATVYGTESLFIHSGAQKDDKGNWSLLAVNMELADEVEVTFEFEKSVGHTVFYRHLYNANEQYATAEAKLIGIDKVVVSDGNSLVDILPPGSMAVYTTVRD